MTERPIGAIDDSPLVVLTSDLARHLDRHLNENGRPNYERTVQRIKAAKAVGQIIHGVSYEMLKRINEKDSEVTAESCADEILVALGDQDLLGREIPIYRNPAMSDSKYLRVMEHRLQKEWDDIEDPAFIESFPSITPQ